jgi:hypothetical protein
VTLDPLVTPEARMPDRRYTDEDVRRILALAAEAEAAGSDPERPWTLDEVTRIGTEAGLAPQTIAAAALALERQDAQPRPARWLGLPVAVTRSVPLGRHLTDADWDRLVAQMRDTFAAGGRTQVSGARREWRVGNLRVTHEPAGSGALLELRTRKGDARAFIQLGALLVVLAVVVGALATAGVFDGAGEGRRMATAWLLGSGGLAMLLVGALRLPAWARERARQFEALADFARRISAS